jgi:hypothetical protein
MVTQQHIDELSLRFAKFKNAPAYPCVSYFKYVRGIWVRDGEISNSDEQFILHCFHSTTDKLRYRAYMWGKWYDIEPKRVQLYNILTQKQAKKVFY